MELQSSQHELIVCILQQIKKAIDDFQTWNQSVISVDDYFDTPDGQQKLAASCMLLEAIGEGFKKVETVNQELLLEQPNIPWQQIIGMRNHIAHGYFDIDAELVFNTIKNDLGPLKSAVVYFIERLQTSR